VFDQLYDTAPTGFQVDAIVRAPRGKAMNDSDATTSVEAEWEIDTGFFWMARRTLSVPGSDRPADRIIQYSNKKHPLRSAVKLRAT
jgi:hypothetical protein